MGDVAPEAASPARGAEHDEQDEAVSGYDLDGGSPLHRHRAAVGGKEVHLTGELTGRQGGGPLPGRGVGAAGDEVVDRAAKQLLAAVAQELEVRPVGVDVATTLVEQHH